MKHVLPAIVSPSPGNFAGNIRTLDEIVIDNKLIDSRKHVPKQGVIFKIGLEKAYDHMEWDFVDYMLLRFWFGICWRQ